MDNAAPLRSTDRSKSVEELEGITWAPPSMTSYVTKTSFALRQKPLHDLTNEELRIGLEQHVGVKYLVPIAIERLENEPLVEARLYEGDLLQSLLDIPRSYWQRNPELQRKVDRIVAAALDQAASRSASWREEILPELREANDRFIGKLASRVWLRPSEGEAPPSTNRPVRGNTLA